MQTLSVGRVNRSAKAAAGSESVLREFLKSAKAAAGGESVLRGVVKTRGVTLIELMVVVALMAILVGFSFPAISSGMESLRISSAAGSIARFFNSALDRAERRQQVVFVTVSAKDSALWMHSTEPGFERKLQMPEGVTIQKVLPELPQESGEPRDFLLYPGGTAPRFGVLIVNRKNQTRIVRVDPITGVPNIERPETP